MMDKLIVETSKTGCVTATDSMSGVVAVYKSPWETIYKEMDSIYKEAEKEVCEILRADNGSFGRPGNDKG